MYRGGGVVGLGLSPKIYHFFTPSLITSLSLSHNVNINNITRPCILVYGQRFLKDATVQKQYPLPKAQSSGKPTYIDIKSVPLPQ